MKKVGWYYLTNNMYFVEVDTNKEKFLATKIVIECKFIICKNFYFHIFIFLPVFHFKFFFNCHFVNI